MRDRILNSTRRIAVVDDDAAVRKALMRLLQTASYEVQTFAGAREFIDTLPQGVPACALIDLQMPDMTGLELQQYLAEARIKFPIIIITTHDAAGSKERCIAAGAAAYLQKPLRKSTLMAAINDAIDRTQHG